MRVRRGGVSVPNSNQTNHLHNTREWFKPIVHETGAPRDDVEKAFEIRDIRDMFSDSSELEYIRWRDMYEEKEKEREVREKVQRMREEKTGVGRWARPENELGVRRDEEADRGASQNEAHTLRRWDLEQQEREEDRGRQWGQQHEAHQDQINQHREDLIESVVWNYERRRVIREKHEKAMKDLKKEWDEIKTKRERAVGEKGAGRQRAERPDNLVYPADSASQVGGGKDKRSVSRSGRRIRENKVFLTLKTPDSVVSDDEDDYPPFVFEPTACSTPLRRFRYRSPSRPRQSQHASRAQVQRPSALFAPLSLSLDNTHESWDSIMGGCSVLLQFHVLLVQYRSRQNYLHPP